MQSSSQSDIEKLIREGYTVKTGEYVSRGWEILKPNLGVFIGYFVLLFVINLVLALIPILGTIATAVIAAPLNAGGMIVALNTLKGRPTTFGDFFKGFDYFLPLFLAGLVMGILVMLGSLLLLIPGIYLAVAYVFTVPLILEKKMDFWEAMEASRKIITKNWYSIFVFVIVLGLINAVGALLLGVGLLVTAPLSVCATAAAYADIVGLRLSSETEPQAE